jgi:uncharacterized protein YkwD
MRRALLCLLAVLALPGCGGPGEPHAAKPDVDGCRDSWLRPTPANAERIKAAMLCLTNAERARVGAAPLTENPKLQLAAERHSLDMATRKFFEHVNPDGVSDAARIVHTGYPPIVIGENLAWGEEEESTPALILKALMDSPGHRANLLNRAYREIGIGLAYAAPEPQPVPRQAAIYTTDFGAGGAR